MMASRVATTIGELEDGDRVVFPGGEHLDDAVKVLRKVWRYDDGSVVLEFAGREPGMWCFRDDDLSLPVEVIGRQDGNDDEE